MTVPEMTALVKQHLNIAGTDKGLIIEDRIMDVMNYCNITDLPREVEPFIRRKVSAVINFESTPQKAFDTKSITVGDTSTSFAVDENHNRDTIYGLSELDKKALRPFRRLR